MLSYQLNLSFLLRNIDAFSLEVVSLRLKNWVSWIECYFFVNFYQFWRNCVIYVLDFLVVLQLFDIFNWIKNLISLFILLWRFLLKRYLKSNLSLWWLSFTVIYFCSKLSLHGFDSNWTWIAAVCLKKFFYWTKVIWCSYCLHSYLSVFWWAFDQTG